MPDAQAELLARYIEDARIGLLAHQLSFMLFGFPDALIQIYQAVTESPSQSIPVVIRRKDGSIYPSPPVEQILHNARWLKGFGFGPDLFSFMMRAISVKL